uniref:Uncharacterized protein n=1 Tax=Arundo donax TaxID=35708 RepID=A0A0A8ZEQ8_ARUDO
MAAQSKSRRWRVAIAQSSHWQRVVAASYCSVEQL